MTKGITILFIDDSSSDRILFRHILHEIDSSINYITADGAKDALDLLSESETLPYYIFLDINMPGMNGIECLAELKKDARLAAIPVIMYSTSDSPSYIETSKQLGATEYLLKSSDINKSVSEIGALLLSLQIHK